VRMEVELEEVLRFYVTSMLYIQLGIHTHHLYMPVATCNVLYQYHLYYTTHSVQGIKTVYMCMCDVQQWEVCEEIVTLLQ
jgi:hypothetical protein